MDPKRICMKGPGVVVRGNDIDTDRIIPARFLRTVTFEGLGQHAFEDDRAEDAKLGRPHPFDDPRFAAAKILLVNANFGCGSSREHAPQAIMRWGHGIEAIIGESFAEIFFGNCVSLGVPCVRASSTDILALMNAVETDPHAAVTVDLEALCASAGATKVPIAIAAGPRQQFITGLWDSTAELLDARPEILARAASIPYFGGFEGKVPASSAVS